MKKNIDDLLIKKKSGRPITMVTAYDFPTAQIADEAGIDAILVGDSVGTNMLGYASEQEVTMEDMLHHTAAAARGITTAFFLADLPYHSVETPDDAEKNARRLLEKGAECVKLEGWRDKCEVVARLSQQNISVCAHIGYNPQIHGARPKVFGATANEAQLLIESALMLEEAGAVLLIIEKVPEEVAGIITANLRIPTIGIGSGRFCSGQVLVMNDLLGISVRTFKHARSFLDYRSLALAAIQTYAAEVEKGGFPEEKNVHHMDPDELERLKLLD